MWYKPEEFFQQFSQLNNINYTKGKGRTRANNHVAELQRMQVKVDNPVQPCLTVKTEKLTLIQLYNIIKLL